MADIPENFQPTGQVLGKSLLRSYLYYIPVSPGLFKSNVVPL